MKLNDTTAKNSFRYSWLLGRVYPYIKPYMSRVILGFLVAIPVGALEGVVAFFLKPYLDYVVGQKDLIFTICNHTYSISWSTLALSIPFAVILFALLQGVLRYLNSYLTDWTSQKITNGVKIALFNKLVYMDSSFFDENTSGVIITRYLSDPDAASTGIVTNLKEIATNVFGAISLIAVMLYSSWRLAIIGVLVLCVAFVPVAIIRKKIKSTSNKNMVIGGNITTNFNETYIGNKVMRAYGLEERQKERFTTQIHCGFTNNMSLVKRAGWMSPLMYLIASFGIAIVLGYGTHLITTGKMTAGGFASFVTSLLLLYKPIKSLGNTLTNLQTIFVALGRVFELFDIKPEITDKQNAINLQELKNGIELKNVSFEYVKGHKVLKNINLNIRKDETLAIVGNSGGGKSTLVNLITRFYDATDGEVLVDGVNVKEFTFNSLRNKVALVLQKSELYTGTIKDNICWGKEDATMDEVEYAAKIAQADSFIKSFNEGYDTFVAEKGSSLSGGQKQRISIARALIKKPEILIFDDSTSALDLQTEANLYKAINESLKDMTIITIAQRVASVRNADKIVVLNDGEIASIGSHDELIKSCPIYQEIYNSQLKKDGE